MIDKHLPLEKTGGFQIATPYATGTGFIMGYEGVIVTNEHVVRDNIQVVIEDRPLPGKRGCCTGMKIRPCHIGASRARQQPPAKHWWAERGGTGRWWSIGLRTSLWL